MPATKTKEVHDKAIQLLDAWRHWKSFHTWLYIIPGVASSVLATIVAANSKAHIIGDTALFVLAVIAAGLTFLINALSAQAIAASFETASRELEKEIAVYETDPDIGDIQLGQAIARCIDSLNKVKPQ